MLYFDAERIQMVLDNPSGYLEGYAHSKIIWKMLQAMYNRQTSLEKDVQATIEDNGMGFNGWDGNFLSNIALQSKKWKNLSPAQARCVAKKLKKYMKQLVEIANEKQPTPAPLLKKQKDTKQLGFWG